MLEFVEYADDQIRIRLPKQLRQQRSQLLFRGNLARGKPETQVLVGIDLNAQSVEARRLVLLRPADERLVTAPIGCRVERFGPCGFGEDGLEFFTSSEIHDKGYTLYLWEGLCRLQGRSVALSIMGGGSREDFESMAEEIMTSLTLESPSQTGRSASVPGRSAIKNVKGGGMPAKEKRRLAKALEALPEELMYLRDPILAMADEDQEMLGCGDVDTGLLAEAFQRQAVSHPGSAAVRAEELKQWLLGFSNPEAAWAGPIWFAQGFLMGYHVYGEE